MADGQGAADPLELEHMIGYTGVGAQSIQYHPAERDTLVGYIGRLVLIANVHDKHQQEFLHGHNEEVTALAISPSGNLIASGQGSSRCVPNSEAMVIVWDWKTRQSIYRLIELNDGIAFSRNCVTHLAFSGDDRFLAGTDDQPGNTKLAVWDMESGQVANLAKRPPLTFLIWGAVVQSERRMNRHPAYHFFAGSDSQIHLYKFEFDVHTMQYSVAASKMAMPSSGLQRKYHSVGMHGGSKFLVAGSSAGELCVFNTETAVFRACIPVSCGGLLALQSSHDETRGQDVVYCGCGDGKLKLLAGQDLDWEMLAETALAGQIRSLGLAADGGLLLAGTSEGNIYILDAKTLAIVGLADDGGPPGPLLSSHTGAIRCLAFGANSERFVTGAEDGLLREWELSHYSVVYEAPPAAKDPTEAHALCCEYVGHGVISGWSDGIIRFHEAGALQWRSAGLAHRGGVCAIAWSPSFIVSGGPDGTLRVWNSSTRAHEAQFSEHKGRVTQVLIDMVKPNLVHSCGEDKTVITVDLRVERRVTCHSSQEGQFQNMVQLATSENELLTCDHGGSIKFWDCDVPEPVSMIVTIPPNEMESTRERRLTHLSLSKGDKYLLASTAAGEVQVWDLHDAAAPISVGIAHSNVVTAAHFSPDGKQVVSVGKDCCICVWNFFGE